MKLTAGKKIETESFRIIRSEMQNHFFSEEEAAVVVRVIHATGDFEYAENIRFSRDAIDAGRNAIRNGYPIITDVNMVKAGLNRKNPGGKNCGTVHCWIDTDETRAAAVEMGTTRAAAAFRLNKTFITDSIVAIGNAPTALLEVLRLAAEEGLRPALVIGVPVGFVNAAESKEFLYTSDLNFITSLGRKGGSPVAAAIFNAIKALE